MFSRFWQWFMQDLPRGLHRGLLAGDVTKTTRMVTFYRNWYDHWRAELTKSETKLKQFDLDREKVSE